MKINDVPRMNLQFHAFLLFFAISNAQIGVGIFSFQSSVFQACGYIAWIAVIIAGLIAHFILWSIIKTLQKYESADLFGIHYDIFGKYAGGVLNILFLFQYICSIVAVMRNYIEIIQVWIFPDIPSWVVIILLSILTFYTSSGGIRVLLGVCVIQFTIILMTVLLSFSPLEYAVWNQLLPIEVDNIKELMSGVMRMGFSLAGFEVVWFLYPFVRNKQKAMLHAHLSLGFTNIVYLFLTIVSLVYFSADQLQEGLWPSIDILKIVKYTYLERIEFIVISIWMVVTMSGLALFIWIIGRGCKRMWNLKPNMIAIITLMLAFVANININEHIEIKQLNAFIGIQVIASTFIYPVLLSFIVMIVHSYRKRKNNKGGQQHESMEDI